MSAETTIYLDNNATTDVDPEVRKIMIQSMQSFCGNPSSSHLEGRTSRHTLEVCRQVCARHLSCRPAEVYFTSGATEANNIVLQGFIRKELREGRRPRILCSPIEHVSVLNPLRHYKNVIDLVECPVMPDGTVEPTEFERLIKRHRIQLATVGAINHEIGTVQNIRALSEICKKHGVLFHSDYTQAVGRVPVFRNVDAIAFSAHKIYGPKGTGLLMLRDRSRHHIDQIIFGGDQENKLRPGTEGVLGIIGLTRALEVTMQRRSSDVKHIETLGRRLLAKLPLPCVVNSASFFAMNLTFPTLSPKTSDDLIAELSRQGICVSRGAACKSRTKSDSYILAAIGIEHPKGPTIRVGIGRYNTPANIDALLGALKKAESS